MAPSAWLLRCRSAGLISFASPCVLPLVPGYLGYVTGLSDTALADRSRSRLVGGASLFVLGFSSVFVLATTTAAGFGSFLIADRELILRIGGVFVIALGLVFVGLVPVPTGRRRHSAPSGLWGAPVLGAVFGVAWSPCTGPTLGAVMMLATTSGDREAVVRGAALGLIYCLGLGLPFILFAAAYSTTSRLCGVLRRRARSVQLAGGLLLVLLGIAMMSGQWESVTTSLQDRLVA